MSFSAAITTEQCTSRRGGVLQVLQLHSQVVRAMHLFQNTSCSTHARFACMTCARSLKTELVLGLAM